MENVYRYLKIYENVDINLHIGSYCSLRKQYQNINNILHSDLNYSPFKLSVAYALSPSNYLYIYFLIKFMNKMLMMFIFF